MAVLRVRPLKVESPSEGGASTDAYFGPTEVDIGNDFIDTCGVTLQAAGTNTSTADALVRLQRTASGALHLTDTLANGTTGLDLSQLLTSVTGATGAFNALQDIRLWLDGPGDGFASGAVRTINCTGLLPTIITWYDSASAKANKLCQSIISYNGLLPAKIVTTLYSSGTLVRTLTDTYTYSTLAYPQTTRVWS